MSYPTYTISTDFPQGGVDERRLYDEIVAAGPYTPTFRGVEKTDNTLRVIFSADPPTAEKTTVDGVIAAHTTPTAIEIARAAKAAEIDATTRKLISNGFQYPPSTGDFFSLSESSQRSLIAADAQRNDPLFTYPVVWNSKDDKTTISLAAATDLHNFCLTAIGTVRAILDSGTVIKDAVRAAATVPIVEAIIDTRLS